MSAVLQKPKIMIDRRWEGPHGIGRFAREVAARIPDLYPISIAGSPAAAVDPWRLSRYLRRNPCDVFFTPGFNAPRSAPCPFIFCLHDLIHLSTSGSAGVLRRLWYENIVKPAGRKAAAVLTVSEYSRKRILEWSDWPADRVVVVGNGVSDSFGPEGPQAEIDSPYVLHVGNHKPHKNCLRLIEAFAQLPQREMRLVFTELADDAELRLIDRLRIADRVIRRPHVEEAQLASLYRSAACVVVPSLEEGFGLPAVEAMSCGTPVVASDCSSLPEVVGDAGLLIDPRSPEAIARAIARIIDDSSLADLLRRRGLERSREFRWDTVANRVRSAILRPTAVLC